MFRVCLAHMKIVISRLALGLYALCYYYYQVETVNLDTTLYVGTITNEDTHKVNQAGTYFFNDNNKVRESTMS